jgi:signal transduction histidine kinase
MKIISLFLASVLFINITLAQNNNITTDTLKIKKLLENGNSYINNKPDTALFYFNSALNLSKKINSKKFISESFKNIGSLYWLTGKNDKALEYYLNALKISEEIDNKVLEAACLHNIGNVYYNQNEYQKSLGYYKKALFFFEKSNLENGIASSSCNVGFALIALYKYDEALKFNTKSLEIYSKLNNKEGMALNYMNIGTIFMYKNQPDFASQYYDLALKLYTDLKSPYGMALVNGNISGLRLLQKKYSDVIKYATLSINYAKETEALFIEVKAYENLTAVYDSLRDYKSSLKYMKIFIQLSDSLSKNESAQNIEELQDKYELEKRENENFELLANNQIQKLAIEKQRNVRNFFIALSLFIVGLLTITYKSLHEKKKINNHLEEQKRLIQIQADNLSKANATKDKFFSIISHDLKNPFNAILGFSELINSNYDGYTDEKRKYFIQEINNSAQITYKMLQNLLTWAMSQRNEIKVNMENINLLEITENAINPYARNATNKNIEISTNIDKNILIFADRNTISTVIGNIVNNAIKFTPIDGKINVFASKTETGKIELHVSDTGVGMSQATIEKLFKIDQTNSQRGTNDESGTGLGLILTYEFVLQNKAEIIVKSIEGKGSDFIIIFDEIKS